MKKLINLLDSEDINDVVAYTKFQHTIWTDEPYIEEYASRDEVKHAASWSGPNFNYKFNKLGFRFNDICESSDIGAYGCSFTMGLGLPEEYLWHKLLEKNLQLTSLNFGVPGASCKTIFDLFLITTKHIKIKHAIFLLPSYNRMQIAVSNLFKDRNFFNHCSLLPNNENEFAKVHGLDALMLFKYIPDEELIKVFKNDIYLIDYIAKHRNIKIYFSSWDTETYNLINRLSFKNSVILPPWRSQSQQQAIEDLARDKKHPGPIHHEQWARLIIDYIK